MHIFYCPLFSLGRLYIKLSIKFGLVHDNNMKMHETYMKTISINTITTIINDSDIQIFVNMNTV